MQTQLLLSVSSQDKPGVVESISSIIEAHGGNWQESRLAHLCGKFVGVIRVLVNEQQTSELEVALAQLINDGISVEIEAPIKPSHEEPTKSAKFSAVGPDRTGIVKEIASAFSRQGINVEELETSLSSMPYSGEPIFEAEGVVSLPQTIQIKDLLDKMDAIANELGLDIDLGALADTE